MLIFDQLRKDDPQLRALTVAVLAGLVILLAGLWWVQIVSARDYQTNLETQSFRTVRIPAVRGKIVDRNGAVLAENRPTYNLSLYLEELRQPFDKAYFRNVARARALLKQRLEDREKQLGRHLNRQERKQFVLTTQDKGKLRQEAIFEVASNVVAQVGERLGQPLSLEPTNFLRHYKTRLALPYPVLVNLDPTNIARFEEQSTSPLGVDLEVQSTRSYPLETTAAHILGYLQRDDSSAEGEESFFSFRLPDYRGVVGIEYGFDKQLRGMAGAKSVLVNNVGYRHTETIWSPATPGQNVVLTIDLAIQQAAERALPVFGPNTRGAAVVMDVQTGDILAMASSPTLNPAYSVTGFPPGEWRRRTDPTLRPLINRATQENYAPGSIFKTVIGLAALEAGLNPKDTISSPGYINIGRRTIHDTAPPGTYDFRRALKLSCNTYFVTNGLRAGAENIVRLGQRLHLGERTGLPTRQETGGVFPNFRTVTMNWSSGDTANLCIGQGAIAVTPLQMTVMTAALANGGKVLWPRLVDRVEAPDAPSTEPAYVVQKGRVRDELGVRPQSLATMQEAMLADVEDADGTGRSAAVPGMRICGKTGTAQVTNERNKVVDHTTWFVSFAPYGKPRYAVVVMVESGQSGAGTCAPIARSIYTAILERERMDAAKGATVAATP